MEKVQRRESFNIDCITQGLIELMKKKDFSKITVSELVKRSGVGRVTFYRNFESKEDVIKRRVETITDVWIKTEGINLSVTSSEFEVMEIVRKLFEFWYTNQEFIQLMIKNNLFYILENEAGRRIKSMLERDSDTYHMDFIIGGFMYAMKNWVMSGCKDSPDDVMKIIKNGTVNSN